MAIRFTVALSGRAWTIHVASVFFAPAALAKQLGPIRQWALVLCVVLLFERLKLYFKFRYFFFNVQKAHPLEQAVSEQALLSWVVRQL